LARFIKSLQNGGLNESIVETESPPHASIAPLPGPYESLDKLFLPGTNPRWPASREFSSVTAGIIRKELAAHAQSRAALKSFSCKL